MTARQIADLPQLAWRARELREGARHEQDSAAWHREMERAQMQNWLSHGLLAHSAAVPGSDVVRAGVTVAKALPATPAQRQHGHATYAHPAAHPTARPSPARRSASFGASASDGLPPRTLARHTELAAASAQGTATGASPMQLPDPADTTVPPSVAQAAAGAGVGQSLPGRQVTTLDTAPLPQQPAVDGGASASLAAQTRALAEQLQPYGVVEIGAPALPLAHLRQGPPGVQPAPAVARPLAAPGPLAPWIQPFAASAGYAPDLASVMPATATASPLAPSAGPTSLDVRPSVQRSGALPMAPGARNAAPPIHEPIRVHADWSGDGVRIWLGMDAGAQPSLPAIQTQLQRWLASQGLRLLGMSCNGRPLDLDAAPRAEWDGAAASTPLPQRVAATPIKEIR